MQITSCEVTNTKYIQIYLTKEHWKMQKKNSELRQDELVIPGIGI